MFLKKKKLIKNSMEIICHAFVWMCYSACLFMEILASRCLKVLHVGKIENSTFGFNI